MRDSVAIVRGALAGERFDYDGTVFSADLPALLPEAHSAATGRCPSTSPRPRRGCRQLAGEIGDGLLTPSITTPAFVALHAARTSPPAPARRGRDRPRRSTSAAPSSPRSTPSDRDAGRDGAREIAGMYLANKFQNIRGSADTLLELAGIEMDELAPVAEAMERGGRLAAKAAVTDSLLDRCRPIAGTPEDCIAAIARLPRGRLHATSCSSSGASDRLEQIRLFAETVLPAFRA